MTVAIPWLTGRAIDQIREGDKAGPDDARARRRWPPASLRLALTVARRLVAGRVSLGVELDLRNRMYAAPAGARARLLRPPADRPAHVARHRRPAGRALLPRLRPGLHPAVGADDRARRRRRCSSCSRAWRRVSLIPVPFVVVIAARYGRRSRPALQELQQRIAELTADVEENIGGVRVVKAFAREDRQLERFRGQRRARVGPGHGHHAPAGLLQPVHRLPAPARPGRDPLLRRAPGHRRAPDDRRVQRLLRLPAHAAVADAHARASRSASPSGPPPPAPASTRSSTASRGSSPRPARRRCRPARATSSCAA